MPESHSIRTESQSPWPLKVFNLERGAEIHSIDEKTLKLPAGITRGWISEVVAYGDSGLFVKAGLSQNTTVFDYFVATLNLSLRTLDPIVRLPAVFM